MDAQTVIEGVQPLVGQILPVKTVQETQSCEQFGDGYAVEINVKCASKVIKTLDSRFTRDPSLGHLRRFAKYTQLPETLQSAIPHDEHSQTIFVLIAPPIPELDTLQTLLAPFAPPPPKNENNPIESTNKISFCPLRIPLQPPLNTKQAERWTKNLWPVILNPAAPRANVCPPPHLLNTSLDSIKPRAGYYLALAQRAAHEAEDSGLGRCVGAVVVDPAIEATMHDTESEDWTQAIVAVAGDARYNRREAGGPSQAEVHTGPGPNPASKTYNADLEGGPELHALMRGIDMVARRRREDDERKSDSTTTVTESSPDKGHLTPLESYFLYETDAPAVSECPEIPPPEKMQKTGTATAQPTKTAELSVSTARIRPRALGGYLCTDLDIYLTREPCLSCCMGLLLSRCRAVIFPRKGRMVTGGVASEPVSSTPEGEEDDAEDATAQEHDAETETRDKSRDPRNNRKYYGLHWRKELNWRALGFEFVEDGYSFEEMGIEGEDGIAFHA